MDVRCEKCQTVYEFDESQVGDQGVTVKCTQCGNLFKVKRRTTTAEMPYGAATRAPKNTDRGIPIGPPPAEPPARGDSDWMLRRASNGKVFRFREIASLRQLILEGKLVREDEVSQDGDSWQLLGEIQELAHDFISVTARGPQAGVTRAMDALANAAAPRPPVAAAPLRSTAAPPPSPKTRASVTSRNPTFSREVPDEPEPPRRASRPSPFGGPDGPSSMGAGLADHDHEHESFADRLPRRGNTPLMLGGAALVLVLIGGGLAWWRHSTANESPHVIAQAEALYAADTDDAFRQATTLLRQASPTGPEHLAALTLIADIEATWAFHLREDARGLEAAGGAAAMAGRTLRTEADVHIADAKRAASEAIGVNADSLEANRALAHVNTVGGAPVNEVEQSLKRALDQRSGDPQSVYIGGVLSYREGRLDDARLRLNQANQLQLATTQRPLVRALFLDGTILAALGRMPEARQSLNAVLAASPQHERARTLLQLLDAATKAAPVASPTVAATSVPSPVAAPVAVTPGGGASGSGGTEPAGDYGHLVATADRAAENGHSDQARKMYDRALVMNPRGLEAVTGLGYCDLDQERFSSAVDRFRRALEIAPDHGEAVIGMAEAFKVRGDRVQALEFYKRYLRTQPGGSKADMAQKNVRDLEPHGSTSETTTTPVDDKGHANGPATTVQTGGDKLPVPAATTDEHKATEPPKAEPGKSTDPAKPEPAKPEPVKPEPVKTEPQKAEPPADPALPHLPAN